MYYNSACSNVVIGIIGIDCIDITIVFSTYVNLRNIILKSDETLVEIMLTPYKHIIALQQVTHVCNWRQLKRTLHTPAVRLSHSLTHSLSPLSLSLSLSRTLSHSLSIYLSILYAHTHTHTHTHILTTCVSSIDNNVVRQVTYNILLYMYSKR
jgi:hypothetical protein